MFLKNDYYMQCCIKRLGLEQKTETEIRVLLIVMKTNIYKINLYIALIVSILILGISIFGEFIEKYSGYGTAIFIISIIILVGSYLYIVKIGSENKSKQLIIEDELKKRGFE